MKKITLAILFAMISMLVFAQDTKEPNLVEQLQSYTPKVISSETNLTLEFDKKKWEVKKEDEILIYLPAAGAADYVFIEKKKSMLSAKLVGKIADAVGSSALAIGLGAGNMDRVINIMQKADAVSYGADALDKIDNLNISSKAKKIAGKKGKVLGWKAIEDDYMLYVKIGKKKYQINYAGAILTNEIKLTK